MKKGVDRAIKIANFEITDEKVYYKPNFSGGNYFKLVRSDINGKCCGKDNTGSHGKCVSQLVGYTNKNEYYFTNDTYTFCTLCFMLGRASKYYY